MPGDPRLSGAQIAPEGDTDWKQWSACKGEDPTLFFAPEPGDDDFGKDPVNQGKTTRARYAKAKAICATCPVMAECLDFAIGAGEKWGVWGGLDPDERYREYRRRKERRRTERIPRVLVWDEEKGRKVRRRIAKTEEAMSA